MSLQKVSSLLLTAMLFVSCASKTLKPEPPLPTKEQLAALLAAPVPNSKVVEPTELRLVVYPRVVLVGQAVKATCYIPESLNARKYAFGMVGVWNSEGPVERVEYTRITDRVPCGTQTFYCVVQTDTETKKLTETLEVSGCDGDR